MHWRHEIPLVDLKIAFVDLEVLMGEEFKVKDSGERQKFDSGMQRDVTTDKVDYTLALDGPMFKRYAEHLTKGAVKYEKRNWMKARGTAERDRFRESALRHFLQWYWGETDEDHAAAVLFNINGFEYVKEQLDKLDVLDVRIDPIYGCVSKTTGEPIDPRLLKPGRIIPVDGDPSK